MLRCLDCPPGRASREGVCGAGADIVGASRAAGDVGEVATAGADDDGEVGKIHELKFQEIKTLYGPCTCGLLSERRDPRGGFRLHRHKRREWDAQCAVPGQFDDSVNDALGLGD